jgi:RND family efflux transporter MFP subunit
MNPALRLILVTAAAAVVTSCAPPRPAAPPPPKVTVARPHTGTVTNWDEYPGHLEATEMVEIRPKVAGYIESIHFEDGSEVKAGDLLFVIDPQPFEADRQRARAERLQAESRLDLARNDLQRAETLRGTKAISDEELDTRREAVREAEARLAAAQAAETSAELNLDYCRVKAPITGRIGRRLVTKGNLVQGGGMVPGTLLATLISVDPVYCHFDVDELAFNRYRLRRLAAQAQPEPLPCELALMGEANFPHRGVVDFFDNQVDAKSGTIRLRGTFANPARLLVPGMFAKVRVQAGPPQEALLVPAVAVGSDQGNRFVLTVNPDGVVEPRPLEVERQHGPWRVVTKGLSPQDRVIVNGLLMARPGSQVEVVESGSTAGAAASAAAR